MDFLSCGENSVWNQLLSGELRRERRLCFFKKYRRVFSEAFSNFERERVLESVFAFSKWVRVIVDGDYIALGIVYKDSKPEKIGVAIASKGINAIKIEHCEFGQMQFYPVSASLNLGYFVAFYSADDGKKLN